MFHESFKEVEVSRMFHDFQGSLKKTLRVFRRSFMLHGTHRSFPSRRRACYSLMLIAVGLFTIPKFHKQNVLAKLKLDLKKFSSTSFCDDDFDAGVSGCIDVVTLL